VSNSKLTEQNGELDTVMSPEQFERIVEAIIAGKYSWACVLILRCAGYNPLHYIPYRTYNRLIKDNCCANNSTQASSVAANDDLSESKSNCDRIEKLTYVDIASQQDMNITAELSSNYVFKS
jgi:hypothetical protein